MTIQISWFPFRDFYIGGGFIEKSLVIWFGRVWISLMWGET